MVHVVNFVNLFHILAVLEAENVAGGAIHYILIVLPLRRHHFGGLRFRVNAATVRAAVRDRFRPEPEIAAIVVVSLFDLTQMLLRLHLPHLGQRRFVVVAHVEDVPRSKRDLVTLSSFAEVFSS